MDGLLEKVSVDRLGDDLWSLVSIPSPTGRERDAAFVYAEMLAIQPAFDASISDAEIGEHEQEEAEMTGGSAEMDQTVLEAGRLLLDAGADPDIKDREGATALIRATFEGRLDFVRILLQAGADPQVESAQAVTPLLGACAGGDIQMVQALLDAGSDPSAGNKAGLTPLMLAANR